MCGSVLFDRGMFPVEFLDECRSLVRKRAVSRSQHQRARLGLLLHETPASSNIAAGAVVDLHPNSIRLGRHHCACSDFSLIEELGGGRKPVFSPLRLGDRQGDCM